MEETFGSSSRMSKFVDLKTFCFNNDQGGTVIDVEHTLRDVEIVQSWEDDEIGRRYIGIVHDKDDLDFLKGRGQTQSPSYNYNPTKVYFGPTDIVSRGGLSATELHTLRLIKNLANDLDPERPKFKSTLDSIEFHVQELKKSMKIDTPVQQSSGKEI